MNHCNSSVPNLEIVPAENWRETLIIGIILVGMAILVYLEFSFVALEQLVVIHNHGLIRNSGLWMLMGIILLIFHTLLWLRYRPFPLATELDAPSLTVIIPAYNEGRMVEKSIESVAQADYPRHLLRIIVIDDGSQDDTWSYIEQATRRYPDLITSIQFAHNRGKRAALAEGFRQAQSKIVITIDSDSVIERSALLAMVGPFRDPQVGAVAGKVSVYNRFESLIPRMLHVRFTLSFDFLRSAQSTYGTVYCCPGALAGYRLSGVRQVLNSWENQNFLGGVCTFGEDRALTNYLLAERYNSVYQRTAVVHTIVPDNYRKLCKMYLRWDRSFIREEIRFSKIVWKRPPLALVLSLIDRVLTDCRYPLALFSFSLFIVDSIHAPINFLMMLISIGVISFFYMLYFLRSERSWEFFYGILYAYFSFFTLSWIFPYALLTARARSWLTR